MSQFQYSSQVEKENDTTKRMDSENPCEKDQTKMKKKSKIKYQRESRARKIPIAVEGGRR